MMTGVLAAVVNFSIGDNGDYLDFIIDVVKGFWAVLVLADLDEMAMGIIIRVLNSLSCTVNDLESFIYDKLKPHHYRNGLVLQPRALGAISR